MIKTLPPAYPVNGALMGALDWSASAVAMWAAQLGCLLTVLLFSRGGTRVLSLNDLWTSLAVLFTMQIVVGLARMFSGRGPWAALKRAGAEEAAADAAVAAAAAAAAAPPVVSWYDSGQRLK